MSINLIQIHKDAAMQAFLTKLQEVTQKTRAVQNDFAARYKTVMSAKDIDNPELSARLKSLQQSLQEELNRIINGVAGQITHQATSYTQYFGNCDLMAYDELRVNEYVNTVMKINTSIQKIKFLLEVFSRINKYILEKLENSLRSDNIGDSNMFVLGNMLLVLMLTEYVIKYLNNYKLEGIDDIKNIYYKEIDKIDKNMEDINKLIKNAQSPQIDIKVKVKIEDNLQARINSLDYIKKEWDSYIGKINVLQENVGNITKSIPTLELIRGNVQNQIEFYDIMKFFGIMMIAELIRENLTTIEIVTLPLDQIELISLSPDTVNQLICLTKLKKDIVVNPKA